MSLLSEQAEQELTQSVLSRLDKMINIKLQQADKIKYKKKADLKKKLKINEAYYKKLVKAGLREVILEDGDRTIWNSEEQFNQLMDELAE
ncbi:MULTISPECIES: hypothetical protein [Lactococcus]|uniref:Prophage ps3 protein 12 n=1 Tax=Lactococcus formosensis TaxID=1281486 RepID=A0A9X4P5Y1_9LACT|nr:MULTISPECIES: hypothetical protein [Lactococcus]MDG6142030.1 hypothetical protein [Lactococcus formosensis]MDG6159234.1 hypothetical protein [Lactococcus formosensis]MDG6165469.1 hypothetical protein [Lactococcus formosensis]MDG6171922.1 hypothetical protein [Lactococcus formosensis]MDG6192688.1 hypothetical protein [Lactococcus formosensis]